MKVTGANIQYYLDKGVPVTSRAVGRVGKVTRTDGEIVYIRLRNGEEGCTTFTRGDPVEFFFHEDYYVDIVNVD